MSSTRRLPWRHKERNESKGGARRENCAAEGPTANTSWSVARFSAARADEQQDSGSMESEAFHTSGERRTDLPTHWALSVPLPSRFLRKQHLTDNFRAATLRKASPHRSAILENLRFSKMSGIVLCEWFGGANDCHVGAWESGTV